MKTGEGIKKETETVVQHFQELLTTVGERLLIWVILNAQTWIKANGKQYGWCWGEAQLEPWHFTYDLGIVLKKVCRLKIKLYICFLILKSMKEKIAKEAEEYKNHSKKDLKKVIATYKFFKLLNDDTLNFVFSFVMVLIPQILFFGINLVTVTFSIIFHFFVVWRIAVKKYKLKLVKDDEKEDIEDILTIINGYLNSN
jgi:hypothetical protein